MLAPATDPEAAAAVRWLPPAFATLRDEPVAQLAPGSGGKVGVLRLRFERRGGRTRLAELYSTGAQRVQRVHYLDRALPDMAVVFIQSVGGGILQGDRLAVEISVAPGARALVTTQSATKVYRMEDNCATQRIEARVADGGYLELLTDYLIPYRGARLYNEVELVAGSEATVIYSDGVSPGRVASGESFAYDLLHHRLRARHPVGGLRLADTMVLAPAQADPSARPGVLLGHRDIGSMSVLTGGTTPGGPTGRPTPSAQTGGTTPDELAAALHAGLRRAPGVLGSASELPGGDGVSVRALGDSSRRVQEALHGAWRTARAALLATDVPPIYRLKYGKDPVPVPQQPEGAD